MNHFDIIVVGGGHAGIEAALVSARMGCSTALVSFSIDSIGRMSCNPAIGGLGKGQLVKEIDALYGEMGLAIDDTGIQFRILNASKGPAVRSSRAQADRLLYHKRMLHAVTTCPKLTIIEGEVTELLAESNQISGIKLSDSSVIRSKCVVLTTGTFLRGLMHTGPRQTIGGRVGEKAAEQLSQSIISLGLKMGRLKTGTPPRIKRSSINFDVLEEQPGDSQVQPFSFRSAAISRPQISCWITHTNDSTHAIIRGDRDKSPLFNGQIKGTGPRYCPSIEDKVFRFPDKSSHHIFLEPEGFESDIVYPNGISTSLPIETQRAFIASIRGLENAEILQPGYAVEYDFVDPRELNHTFETRAITGLFLAGQINGTSGYEEAGAQGILAGINAALRATDRELITLSRDQAYIGVMVDDLTTLGVLEPYRMFTSRAEYRLLLREDNADQRLTPLARSLGLVDDHHWARFEANNSLCHNEKLRLEKTIIKPTPEINSWLSSFPSAELAEVTSLANLLKRPEVTHQAISLQFPAPDDITNHLATRVETEIKFAGYIKRQQEDIVRTQRMEITKIPLTFDYSTIPGLSVEVKERLRQSRPETLGQASRISGVTPAAVSLLAIYLRRETATHSPNEKRDQYCA